MKTFQYRLYPTKEQQRLLSRQLEECRWLWNTLLAERKQAWEERRVVVGYYAQKAELPALKARERPALAEVHSQVLQDVVLRLKKAFDAFFGRNKVGETPGYPRFRGKGRYVSLTFPQVPVGCALDMEEKRLVVSKVGRIKVLLHRTLQGTPKTATIRRTATGKWFVSFVCEWEPTPFPSTGQEVGLDVGLKVFTMPSQGNEIENPRFFRVEERELVKTQRKYQASLDAHKAVRAALTDLVKAAHPDLDVRQIGQRVSQDAQEWMTWRERVRRRKIVARVHERICWRRGDFTHQQSRRLVNSYDFLAVEDLSVRSMVQNHALAKSIHDAAWNQFAVLLRSKAEWAGRVCVTVNPRHTSQTCSSCGWRNPALTLADRVFHCLNPARPDCRLVLDRDRNAALNILARGKDCVALGRQCLGSP
ncbi:MAG TPA: transposase [Ktedonobacterales bacterium]|nr:transposase [Ktedonobacterales bacterium]